MDWGGPEFVLGIMAIGTLGSLGRFLIASRHGVELPRRGRRLQPPAEEAGEANRLRTQNAELKAHLAKIEDRTRVLERIVTDRGYSVSAEIEALRHTPVDAGVPLAIEKERV